METTDIHLAAFLKTKGFTCSVKKIGKRGTFIFNNDAKLCIDEFYGENSLFLKYALNLRALKSQVYNTSE